MRRAVLALLLLTAACSERKDAEVPREAQAQVDLFGQPWLARGTEPFWSVTVDKDGLRLERPDQGPLQAKISTRGVTEDSATWLAEATSGEILALALTRKPCSDGMSDMNYAWSASLKIGAEELRGCAGPAAALKARAESAQPRP